MAVEGTVCWLIQLNLTLHSLEERKLLAECSSESGSCHIQMVIDQGQATNQ